MRMNENAQPCPLCDEPPHPGKPCYAQLKAEWKDKDIKRHIEKLSDMIPDHIYSARIKEGGLWGGV
jgi:hypothetical protein